jgi:thiamine-monophosphate kinase
VRAAALPIHRAATALAPRVGRDALDWALGGGEDYELVFTAPPARVPDLVRAVVERTGTPATVVGEIVGDRESRTIVLADGTRRRFGVGGWRHFG